MLFSLASACFLVGDLLVDDGPDLLFFLLSRSPRLVTRIASPGDTAGRGSCKGAADTEAAVSLQASVSIGDKVCNSSGHSRSVRREQAASNRAGEGAEEFGATTVGGLAGAADDDGFKPPDQTNSPSAAMISSLERLFLVLKITPKTALLIRRTVSPETMNEVFVSNKSSRFAEGCKILAAFHELQYC